MSGGTRLLVRDGGAVVERPAEELPEHRAKPCWIDIPDRRSPELARVAAELHLHPLAVEDAAEPDERPKIDQYDGHYLIVFYAIEADGAGGVRYSELTIFVAPNAIVTVHDGEFAAHAKVEKRFREGRLASTGLLLHALLDTMVDQYFDVADRFGDRIDQLEEFITADPHGSRDAHGPLQDLFLLKRDLLKLRHTIAPEREVLQVLVRGDIAELSDPAQRVYFQDVYDHILRVTDEIDTFRELTSNVIDAYLAAASNRLNEVVKVLTSIATVLLVLTVVTGFFGQNWDFIPYGSAPLFWLTTAGTVLVAVGLTVYFRRRGWL